MHFSSTAPLLYEKNIQLLNDVFDIFKVTASTKMADLKFRITESRIKDIYKKVNALYPRDLPIYDILPLSDHKNLRALYLGEISPDQIMRNVFRISLYTDQVLVVQPFHYPWAMHEMHSPLKNPSKYINDTLKLVYFCCMIEPWVRSGIVALIPDPEVFDLPIRRALMPLYREKERSFKILPDEMEEMKEDMNIEQRRMVLNYPRYKHYNDLKFLYPNKDETFINGVLSKMDEERAADPLIPRYRIDELGEQMLVKRMGVSSEIGVLIGQITGSFPFTAERPVWRQLLNHAPNLSDRAKQWSPLAKAFGELDFQFLNAVDSKFACKLREDGRLEGMRTFLRKVWGDVEIIDPKFSIDSKCFDFCDELKSEYFKAKSEWGAIENDVYKFGGASVLGVAGSTANALVSGGLHLGITLIGLSVTSVFKTVEAIKMKNQFRQNTPMSIFLDLARRKNTGSK